MVNLLLWRDNEVYGHGAALREYCGRKGTILGHVQHGWNPGTGWELVGRELLRRHSRRIVWGDRQLRRSSELGIKTRAAIGAPWLYSQINRQPGLVEKPIKPSYVFFPMHGTDKHPLADKVSSIREAQEISGENQLSVCLFWRDLQDLNNPFIREAKERGISLVTAGNPNSLQFLDNLYSILASNTDFITNRVSTSLFYAAHLGLNIHLTTSIPLIVGEDSMDSRLAEIVESISASSASSSELKIISDYELGVKHIKAPEELAQILGLSFPSNLAKYPMLGVSAISRIARRLGVE